MIIHSPGDFALVPKWNPMKLPSRKHNPFLFRACGMSKSVSLSGTAIDFAKIRSAVKEDLVSLLQEVSFRILR